MSKSYVQSCKRFQSYRSIACHSYKPQWTWSCAEEPGFWSFTLWGKLVDAEDALQGLHFQPPPSQRPVNRPLTHYLKRMVLTILSQGDKEGQPEVMTWTKASQKGDPKDRFYLR